MTVLVEGFSDDAASLAVLLAREGAHVRLAGAGQAPQETAASLRALGVVVDEGVDLDLDPGEPHTAYLDVWTPAVAPRVQRMRAVGTRITCLGDLLLERSSVRALGVTGTAGKTTTTLLLAHLLRAAGIPVLAVDASPNGNLWPSSGHLALLESAAPSAWLLLELTSSHLAFMARSPHVAVVTTFWPDHLELHGSLDAYRAAKETIVRHQSAADTVAVDVSSSEVASFADRTPAMRVGFASGPSPGIGVRVRLDGNTVVLDDRLAAPLPAAPAYRAARAVNVAAACAAALVVGVTPQGIAESLGTIESPPLRELLVQACDEAARAARVAVVFGPARARLVPLPRARGVVAVEADTLDEAVAAAMERERGADGVVFAPMFPVSPTDRERFAGLAVGLPQPA